MRVPSPVAASGGHSSSRCAGLSPSQPLSLWSRSSRRAGSVIVAHGPSCSVACGIFPGQGSNPCPLHWQADSQPLCHQGSPRKSFLTHYFIVFVVHSEIFWHIMKFKHSSNLSNLSYKSILFCNVSFGFLVIIFTLIPCFYLFFWIPPSCHLETLAISITFIWKFIYDSSNIWISHHNVFAPITIICFFYLFLINFCYFYISLLNTRCLVFKTSWWF